METVAPESVGMSSERLARIGPAMQRHVAGGPPSDANLRAARWSEGVYVDASGLAVRGQEPD
jgi:hypothetical protein